MNDIKDNTDPREPSPEDKKYALYLRQKALLETFLEKGAISQRQFDKSFHDLTVKMGYGTDKGSTGSD